MRRLCLVYDETLLRACASSVCITGLQVPHCIVTRPTTADWWNSISYPLHSANSTWDTGRTNNITQSQQTSTLISALIKSTCAYLCTEKGRGGTVIIQMPRVNNLIYVPMCYITKEKPISGLYSEEHWSDTIADFPVWLLQTSKSRPAGLAIPSHTAVHDWLWVVVLMLRMWKIPGYYHGMDTDCQPIQATAR